MATEIESGGMNVLKEGPVLCIVLDSIGFYLRRIGFYLRRRNGLG